MQYPMPGRSGISTGLLTYLLLALSFCLLLSFTANAQTHTQYVYWLRYQNQLQFNPSVYWTNEADTRRFFNPDVQNQLIFHSRIHYKTGPWDAACGLTYSLAYAAFPETGFKRPVGELRPVIEITHEYPRRNLILYNRIRVDNRFFETFTDNGLVNEWYYVPRARYRIQARLPLIKNEQAIETWILRIANEVMVNFRKNTFDQNRVYVTGDIYLTKNFSLEAGYIFIYQQRFGTDEFFARHVARFSLLHKVKLY